MAGRSSRSSGNSNDRVQALVESKLAEGLQYEALQLYRGVVSRKSARGNDDAALAIAEQGIGVLLGKGYADSATELGNVLVGILSDHELPPTEERVGVIKRVNTKYEDAKRAAVLAEEDRRAATEEEEEGNTAAATGEKEAARGMYSIGVLQVRILFQFGGGSELDKGGDSRRVCARGLVSYQAHLWDEPTRHDWKIRGSCCLCNTIRVQMGKLAKVVKARSVLRLAQNSGIIAKHTAYRVGRSLVCTEASTSLGSPLLFVRRSGGQWP